MLNILTIFLLMRFGEKGLGVKAEAGEPKAFLTNMHLNVIKFKNAKRG